MKWFAAIVMLLYLSGWMLYLGVTGQWSHNNLGGTDEVPIASLSELENEVLAARGPGLDDSVQSWEDLVQYNAFLPAGAADYNRWMSEFIISGGQPGSYCQSPLHTDRLFIATRKFVMMPLFGANAIEVIVPEGVEFEGGHLGHCTLFFMEGGRVMNGAIVTAYSDTDVEGVRSVHRDVIPHLRSPNGAEIEEWGAILNAGSHSLEDVFVAKNDFELLPMHGVDALVVLVPEGVTVSGSYLGHNRLYRME